MKRVVRYSAYGFAALVVLVVAAGFVATRLLERPRMAAQIQAKLSTALQGEVRWKQFSVRLLPMPHARLRELEVKTAAATFTTEKVDVALRLWPLFRARAEIISLDIVRPVLQLTIVPAAAIPKEAQLEPATDTLQAYRSAIGAIVGALQQFAPDTVVTLSKGEVDVHVEDMPPLELKDLGLRAVTSTHGVQLEASAASRYWTTLKLAGSIEYSDLSSNAELQLTRISGQAWLDWVLRSTGIRAAVPTVDLNIRFHGDAAKALEIALDGAAPTVALKHEAQSFVVAPLVLKGKLVADAAAATFQVEKVDLGASGLAGGALRYVPKQDAIDGEFGFKIDLAQVAGYARQLAPDAAGRLESATGALQGRAKLALRGGDYRFAANIDKSDAALQVKALPGPIRLTRVAVEVDPKAVKVERAAVSMPAGEITLSSLRYAMKDGAIAAAGDFDLGIAPTLELVRAALPAENRAALDIVESAGGRAHGTVKGALAGKQWSGEVNIAQSDANVQLRGLPGPATLAGASLRATPKAITVDRVTVVLLDAKATASATITDFEKAPSAQGALAEATIGPKLLDWAWQTQKLPPGLQPKAPIRLTAPHFAWTPKPALALQANARFEAGTTVAVDLGWSGDGLDLRLATIKDKRSDVALTLQMKGDVLSGKYAGTLDSRSIAAMLKSAAAPAGAIGGELAFTIDRKEPRRTQAEGSLKGEGLDLTWLAGKPAKVERIDLTADANSVRIAEASIEWAGQHVSLRGETKRTAKGPVIDAVLESPGVLVDALLPPASAKPAEKPPAKSAEKAQTPLNIWPLPVSGKIAVRSKLVQYGQYKVAPLTATIVLEEERATLDIDEAFLCGFALPLTLEATPKGFAVTAEVAAQKQNLGEAAHCLTGEKVQLTGTMNLRVDVRTQGKPEELLKNLKGTVSADVRDGQVMKFALIGNILSMKNVVAMLGQGGPNLTGDGFPFRQLAAKGRFDNGRFLLDEGLFRSSAVGLGANGWISLADYQTSLTVLVAPLALLNEAVSKVPIIGYVAGGALTSIPVAVNGDIRNPLVVPLGPRAITSELKGIFERTITLPGQLIPGESKP